MLKIKKHILNQSFSTLLQANQNFRQTPDLLHLYNKKLTRKAFNFLRVTKF